MFLLESPHRGDSNEYTQYTIFNIKIENQINLSQICSFGILFQGTHERVRNSRGKRATSVRAIEVLRYLVKKSSHYARDKTVKYGLFMNVQ